MFKLVAGSMPDAILPWPFPNKASAWDCYLKVFIKSAKYKIKRMPIAHTVANAGTVFPELPMHAPGR